MEETKKQSEARRRRAAYVQLTEKQYWRLQKDSLIRGDSIADLLRESYLKHPPISPFMGIEDVRSTLAELRNIVNGINTIAKAVNSGFREGWNEDFHKVYEQLLSLRRFVVGFRSEKP